MTTNTFYAVGFAVAHLLPLALMVWAAVETEGVLRWLLICWVLLVVLLTTIRSAMSAADSGDEPDSPPGARR